MKVPVPGSTVHRWSLHERYLLESDGADLVSSNGFFFPVVTRVLGSSYKKIQKLKKLLEKNQKKYTKCLQNNQRLIEED